jgi:hypothetical protein
VNDFDQNDSIDRDLNAMIDSVVKRLCELTEQLEEQVIREDSVTFAVDPLVGPHGNRAAIANSSSVLKHWRWE